MADDAADAAIRLWERLEGDRGTWKSHWQEVTDYMLPNRADYIIVRSPGMKRMQKVFDGLPGAALQQFAAGLHSLLTSPTLQWFSLHADDNRVNQMRPVRLWLEDATQRMYSIFNSSRHNFASQSGELYLDLGSIGTGVMGVLESPRSSILFTTRHLRECCICENDEDRVDTLVRRWTWTAKQAVESWGERAGPKVLKAFADKPESAFDFIHAVKPRLNRIASLPDVRNMAFESRYISLADKATILEKGFREFPYLVPRMTKSTGELYGRGPGMTALPDIQMLNEMKKTVLKGAQKVIDPPLMVPDDGFMVPIKTVPGSLNYYRAGTQDRIEPIKTEGQTQLGLDMISALQQQILRTLYVEWMLMPSDPTDPAAAGKGVTATYVLQQRDEKMRLLSPMLARLQSEFLGPLIERVFSIMWRQSQLRNWAPGSMLAPPPQQLSGIPLRVEYVSPIAIAQRSAQLDSVGRLISTALSLVQVDQNAPKVLDVEAIMRMTARDLNAPAAALKTPEQMQAEREAEQQLNATIAAHQQLQSLAGVAKDGSAALANVANANDNAGRAAA